jgi:hypothetical protein
MVEDNMTAEGSTIVISEFDLLCSNLEVSKTGSKRAKDLQNWKKRPNVHQGLHLAELAEEYESPLNCNVLLGEDKHR